MILADTSIWIDHLGRGDRTMAALLERERVIVHPFVTGEVALGSLRHRERTLATLRTLPQAPIAEPEEMIRFIERADLAGTGVGYVDAHLLASVLLMPGSGLWTRDKRLRAVAERMGVAAEGG